MSDTLSVLMRELIAAFPEERVQRIPRGVSSEAGYSYVPGATKDADGHLVGGQHWRAGAKVAVRQRARAKRFDALRRREAKTHEPPVETPGLVMLSGPTKAVEARRVRATGALAAKIADGAEKQRRVLARIREGVDYNIIAAELGISRSMVAEYARRLRQSGDLPPYVKPKAKPKPRLRPSVQEMQEDARKRQDCIREMILGGMTRPQIEAVTGKSKSTINNDILALRERGEIPPARATMRIERMKEAVK